MNSARITKKLFYVSDPNFCDGCGSMLPPIPEKGDIKCLNCKKMIAVDELEAVETRYTIWFNNPSEDEFKRKKHKKISDEEGPTVDRQCTKCGFERMSYATAQLRSADEGQTVFFTCLSCNFKESENS